MVCKGVCRARAGEPRAGFDARGVREWICRIKQQLRDGDNKWKRLLRNGSGETEKDWICHTAQTREYAAITKRASVSRMFNERGVLATNTHVMVPGSSSL